MTNSRTSAQCGTATYEVGTLASPAIPNLSTFVSMFGAGVLNLSATDVVVRGFFDVNNGLSWNLDWVTVTLDGNAEIRLIGTNSELIATNSLFTDCGSPWGRIRVSANTRIFADDCEFTGATEAVLVTSSPQLVTLTNNLFIANNTCLRINGAQTPANHTVTNNNFEISAIGISIAQATNVTIGYNLYESNVNYTIPMNAIHLSALVQNDWDFDATEKAAIDAVAARCPQYNGPAVYHARFLQEYYRVPDWSNSDCTPISERAGGGNAAQATNSTMRVFPNPTTGIARIEWSRPASGTCQLQVVNLTGQLMQTEAVEENTTTLSLPVGALPNGHYFLHLSDGSRTLHRQKLAILH